MSAPTDLLSMYNAGKKDAFDLCVLIGCLVGAGAVLLTTYAVDEIRTEERAACQRKIDAMVTKPIAPPAPDLMMQKLKCVDRQNKAGSPCRAWRLKETAA